MKIQINVTKEILERSKNCGQAITATNCAISLAIRDLFPNAMVYNVWVHLLYYNPNTINSPDVIRLPKIAQKFILMFDRRTPKGRTHMKPISFEIDVTDYVINKIGIGTIYKVLSESKTLQHVNP